MAVSPAAEQIPQASDPLAAPPATRAPVRCPASSEPRSTSRLSGPGVTVTISDNMANAAILVIMALPAFPCPPHPRRAWHLVARVWSGLLGLSPGRWQTG